MKKAFVVGTFDTKAEELGYLVERLEAAGVATVSVDLGTRSDGAAADIGPAEVAEHHPKGAAAVLETDDRGSAVSAMALAFEQMVRERDDIGGMIGAGGSGGTTMVTPAMRALPVGVPKVMVSTVASGNVAPYVGPNDIAMMYSVVDIAGLNSISRRVLANAAGMKVVALSCMTNYAAGISPHPLTHGEVTETTRATMPVMRKTLEGFWEKLAGWKVPTE